VLTCFHIYRFGRKFKAIRDVLRTGRLGRLVEIKAAMYSFTRRNDWVMRKARGGGMHNVWGSHLVDECLQLAGSPVKDVFSDLQCTVTPGDADDHCKIVMRCENGTLIDVEISNCMAVPLASQWIIAGTQGSLTMTPDGVWVKWYDPAKVPSLEVLEGPAMGRRYGNDDTLPWEEKVIPLPETDSYGAFYDNLATVIRDGAPLAVTPESVRDTVAVLELCRKQNPTIWSGID
jgi:scyllo-inositol 2-dehydrogenase (NADP+)